MGFLGVPLAARVLGAMLAVGVVEKVSMDHPRIQPCSLGRWPIKGRGRQLFGKQSIKQKWVKEGQEVSAMAGGSVFLPSGDVVQAISARRELRLRVSISETCKALGVACSCSSFPASINLCGGHSRR